MRLEIVGATLLGALSVGASARADAELLNDTFVSGGTVAFQSGFVIGEAGASRFVAPMAGAQLLKVHLLFGGSTATQTVTLKVWDDTGGTDAPGAELFSGDFSLTGNDTAMQEIDVSGSGVVVTTQFRVGLVFQHAGAPSIAHDTVPPVKVDRNYIMAQGAGWGKAQRFSVNGNWVIRAVITTPVGGADGGGGNPDGGTGGACSGNASCPVGQYCNLTTHACTFDCRTNADCQNRVCNSLGQCVAASKSGCTMGGDGRAAVFVLAMFGALLALALRRRSAR